MFKISDTVIVKLNDLGNQTTQAAPLKLFIVAGIEGNCDALSDLAEKLASHNVQAFGIQYANQVPTRTIESMAEFYLTEIETFLSNDSATTTASRGIYLAGYSFGGCVAIEMCRQLEERKKSDRPVGLDVLNLVLFESSHIFFRIGVHSYGKMFGFQVPIDNFFSYSFMYASSLTIFFSFLVGQSSKEFKLKLFDELNRTRSVDEAISRALEYTREKSLFDFDAEEAQDIRIYLKHLLDKSKAATMYRFPPDRLLETPVALVRSTKFMYDKLDQGLTAVDAVTRQEVPFQIDHNDYSLKEIAKNVSVFIAPRGNHFSFLAEASDEIGQFLLTNVFKATSKALKSKL